MRGLQDTHRRLLEQWRHTVNLVGPGEVSFHFRDCELALSGLEPQGHWADLGSGAGFPGLVFASVFPGVPLDLVESRKKRAVFLNEVLSAADPTPDGVRVIGSRVESLSDGAYDGILARAFAPPEVVLTHASRLLRPGGTVLLFLQDTGAIPKSDRFVLNYENRYSLGDRSRKSVLLGLVS